jgi:hypothetical protein
MKRVGDGGEIRVRAVRSGLGLVLVCFCIRTPLAQGRLGTLDGALASTPACVGEARRYSSQDCMVSRLHALPAATKCSSASLSPGLPHAPFLHTSLQCMPSCAPLLTNSALPC